MMGRRWCEGEWGEGVFSGGMGGGGSLFSKFGII